MNPSNENTKLAEHCIKGCSQCCLKGKVLLFNEEYESIHSFLQKTSVKKLEEFINNCEIFDDFVLLNQNNKCQFLDSKNLCTLHDLGLKPKECFWWPAHFYLLNENELEIMLGTYCCDSYKFLSGKSEHINKMRTDIDDEKLSILLKFRKIYNGNPQNKIRISS